MKTLKRIIAVCIMLCLSAMSVYATVYTDIPEGALDEAVAFLTDLGATEGYEDGSFKPELGINRADFSIMFAKLLGYNGEEYNVQHFSDVPADNKSYLYVEYLYEKGIKIELENRKFGPDEAITYRQAATMLLSALGYDKYAKFYENQEAAYDDLAIKTGLYKRLSVGSGGAMTRGNACHMLFNFVKAPVVSANMSTASWEYYIDNSKSFLSEVLEWEVYEGIFVADSSMAVYGDWSLSDNKVVIDYQIYNTTLTNKSDLVGHNVRYYVDKEDNVKVIYDLSGESITISDKYIDGDSTVNRISWEDEKTGKVKYKNIAPDAFYIYNGRNYPGMTDDDIRNTNGQIKLIDNDDDGIIDVVIVWDYDIYILDSYTAMTEKMSFKNTDEILSLSDIDYTIFKDGQKITVSELAAKDVLSVTKNKDNNLYCFKVSSNKVSGNLDAKWDSDNKISVDDVKYDASDEVMSTLYVGKFYDFYIDTFGEIVYAVETSPLKYAYLYGAYINEDDEEDIIIKIFNTDGEFEICHLSQRVNLIVGSETKNYKAPALYNNVLKPGGEVQEQLIKIELNKENKVKTISMAEFDSTGWQYEDFSERWEVWGSNEFVCNMDSSKLLESGILTSEVAVTENNYFQWRNGSGKQQQFSAKVNSDTQVFVITKDMSNWLSKKATDFGAGGTFNSTKVYDITENGFIKCFVVYQDVLVLSESFGESDPFVCIDKKLIEVDEDDEIVYTITGLSNTDGMTKYFVTDEELVSKSDYSFHNGIKFSELNSGDIIQAKVDNYGEISAFRLVHKNGEDIEYAGKGFGDWGSIPPVSHANLYFGPVNVKGGSNIIYKNSSDVIEKAEAGEYEYPVLSTNRMLEPAGIVWGDKALGVFYTGSRTLTQIAENQAFACDKVFIYSYPGKGGCFVIFYN